jgi:hypothetical protein
MRKYRSFADGLKTGLIDLFSRFWQGKNAQISAIRRGLSELVKSTLSCPSWSDL